MEDVHGRLALWSLYSIITLLNSSPLLLPKTINCKNDTCDYNRSQSDKIDDICKFKGALNLMICCMFFIACAFNMY